MRKEYHLNFASQDPLNRDEVKNKPHWILEFDESDRLIQAQEYDSSGLLVCVRDIEYDESENVAFERFYDLELRLTRKIIPADSDSPQIEYYGRNGELVRKQSPPRC